MDKNIAALMRQDTKTVSVRFFQDRNSQDYTQDDSNSLGLGSSTKLSTKSYIYVTNLHLKVGDLCITFVEGMPRCVVVESVDNDCAIEPNSSIQYKWIVTQIDLTGHAENMEKNKQITDLVAANYKKNIRSQFSTMLLASMDENAQKALSNLIQGECHGNSEAQVEG